MGEHAYTSVSTNDNDTEIQLKHSSNMQQINVITDNGSINNTHHHNSNTINNVPTNDGTDLFAGYSSAIDAIRHSAEVRALIKHNVIEIASLAWPVVLSYVLQFSLYTVNIIFLGHLDSKYLAASALGNMFCNVTGYSLIYGLATSVDTLCSQAYGSGQYKQMTLIALRACLMLTLCTLPVYGIWFYSDSLLIYAGQNSEIAELASQFIWRVSPGMTPMILYEVLKKWCQAQRIVKLFLVIGIAANIFNAVMCYLLIHVLDLGFYGAPYATAAANWFMLLFAIVLIRYKRYHVESWPSNLQWKDLSIGWKQLFVLGIPGMFMICCEWWAFEIMSLCAGWISTLALDSFVVCLNVISIGYTVPLGIGIAASTIVGNLLGANTPDQAKLASLCSIIIGGCIATINAIVMITFRYELGSVFSNDADVISAVSALIPWFALDHWVEGVQGVASGVLRGAGKQSLGAKANLVGYWAVCIPIALVLAFHGWDVMGLIIGLTCGVTTTLIVYTYTLVKLNWYTEASKAQARLAAERELEQVDNGAAIDTYDNTIDIELAKIDSTHTSLHVNDVGLSLRSPISGGVVVRHNSIDNQHAHTNSTHSSHHKQFEL